MRSMPRPSGGARPIAARQALADQVHALGSDRARLASELDEATARARGSRPPIARSAQRIDQRHRNHPRRAGVRMNKRFETLDVPGQRHHQRPAVPHGLRGRPGRPSDDSARELDARIGGLRAKFGEIGDTRLTVMAAITVADELAEAGAAHQAAGRGARRLAGRPRRSPPTATKPRRPRSPPRSPPRPSASRASPRSSIRPSAPAAWRWGNCPLPRERSTREAQVRAAAG